MTAFLYFVTYDKKYLNTDYTFSKHLGYDLILITYKKVPKAKNQYETCNICIFYNYTSNMWLYSNNSTEMLAVRFMSLSARLLKGYGVTEKNDKNFMSDNSL